MTPTETGASSAVRIAEVIGDLPAMPHIAAQVLEKLSDDDSTPKEINQLITKDQALAAMVLKVANSPFYGASRSIATLNDAVMFMGFEAIRSLIMTAVLKSMYSKVGLAEKLLWEHSVGCGLAARKIADEVRYPQKDEAYLAGLMHDVGKTALFLHDPEAMLKIMESVYNEGLDFFNAEKRRFGFTHARVGGAIANKWRFTSGIEEAIANHHQPELARSSAALAHIVNAANSICHKLEVGPTRKPDLDIDRVKSIKALGLNPERIEKILVALKEALQADPATL
ncbi:MAG: HDOD domain-containing protein [Deltaproteobacteria bacterium]|jgi:putative nucleotidyltransferase with HDIG domain|nr:HDOD domain-containing protein [Deltaproteobacteria bacterium]MDA8308849.1 HDOD domain-containing protein [Deltaproteobacteria bacterium]